MSEVISYASAAVFFCAMLYAAYGASHYGDFDGFTAALGFGCVGVVASLGNCVGDNSYAIAVYTIAVILSLATIINIYCAAKRQNNYEGIKWFGLFAAAFAVWACILAD